MDTIDFDSLTEPQKSVFRAWPYMTEWQQSKFIRLVIRLRNDDPRAKRLCEMNRAGQIDLNRLLSLM